jgi:hypothetical protein
VRARVILLGWEGGGMTAKIATKYDFVKGFERRVHQHDARQLFAKIQPATVSHPGQAHGHVALATLGACVQVGKPESRLLPKTPP